MSYKLSHNIYSNSDSIIKTLYLCSNGTHVEYEAINGKKKTIKIANFKRPTNAQLLHLKESSGGATVPILTKYIPVCVICDKGVLRDMLYFDMKGNYNEG